MFRNKSTCLLLVLALAIPANGVENRTDEANPQSFAFVPRDRIAILGGGLADRMQHDGWLEATIQIRFPKHNLVFRNLGFTGDELSVRMRSAGFGSPEDWLNRVRATVVFAFFGYNESYAGDDGLAKFRGDLEKFVDEAGGEFGGAQRARVVLFSPTAFESSPDRLRPKGDEQNRQLAVYTSAMADVAAKRGVFFVDLYNPTKRLFEESNEVFTINGVHLNERGNEEVANIADQALFGADAADQPQRVAETRDAVCHKNFYWFHRYRVTDGYSTFGGRKGLGGSEWTPRNEDVLMRELEILDAMTANRDQRIWAAANGEDFEVDDSHVPPEIPVASNKPGPLAGGGYPFLGPKESISKMTVAKGMQLELFASEEDFPELENPVQLAVDVRGRLWVAVWPSYPHWKPRDEMNDKLLILEDTDGDGRADRCQTFAANLHNPTGFEFYNGGVYVAQVPDLVFIEDTDGDDREDRRTRVLGGFDSADTHHSINSFVIGSGGGLHFQEGIFHRNQIETAHGPPVRVADGGVYRYEPKTQRVDVYSAYSFPNPHGHVFERWGLNIVHDGTGASPIFGPSFSGHVDYPQRHSGAPSVYQQRTRPCSGTTILSSSHFPEENRDTLLACNVISFQGILQYRLEPEGAGLKGTELEPIVFSSDVNFRPSDVEIGGDGAIYFSDWHNPLIGHMQHNLRDANRDHVHGRVYRVRYRDRPLLKPVPVAGEPIPRLLELLKERDNGPRYRAKIELSGRDSEPVVAALEKWIAQLDRDDPDFEHHLLEGLWVHQHHHVVNEELLHRLLESRDYRVRAAATLVVRHWRTELDDVVPWLRTLITDDHPRVRMMAVLVCSDMGTAEAAEIALQTAADPAGRFLQYTLKEAVATLAPYWKAALKAREPFCRDNPAALDYILKHVGPAELIKLQPTEKLFAVMLARDDVPAADRREALIGLAGIQGREPLNLLVELVQQLGGDGGQVHGEILRVLEKWDPKELVKHDGVFEQLAVHGSQRQIREAALAALSRIDGSPDRAVSLTSDGGGRTLDLVASLGRIPEEAIRSQFYPVVRSWLTESTAPVRLPGVAYEYYEQQPIRSVASGTLDEWTPVGGGNTTSFGLDVPGRRNEWLALRQTAYLEISVAGEYRFHLASDDGSRLYVDGQELINNDGLHGVAWREGSIELSAGQHELVVTFFNATGGIELKLEWEGPGFSRQVVPASKLAAPGDARSVTALNAMRRIPGHPKEKLADLIPMLETGPPYDAILNVVTGVEASHWSSQQAERVVTVITESVSATEIAGRTTSEVRQRLDFVVSLAERLPKGQRDTHLRELEALRVAQLTLQTIPHRMAYDQTTLVVRSGQAVELKFNNPDHMPHNFVLTEPGGLEEVGLMAEVMATQEDAVARNYVPDSDKVLVSSDVVTIRTSYTMHFTAPAKPGVYPYVCTYPGHWRRMFGAMYVVSDVTAYNEDPDGYLASEGISIQDALLEFNREPTDWTYSDLAHLPDQLVDGASFDRGYQLFSVANCVACHRMNDVGNRYGPDLAKLDAKRGPPDILRHILEPSLEIHEEYQSFSVFLDDGRSVIGLITEETDDELKVMEDPLASCEPVVLAKDRIEERLKSLNSLMPSGLLDRLTEEEILDLLAYLVARGDKQAGVYASPR